MPEQNAEKNKGENKESNELLLLGFGDINQRLARLKRQDSVITALRRSEMSFADVNCQTGDATDRGVLRSLLGDKPDQIVITLSPSDRSEEGYANTYLAAAKTLVSAAEESGQSPEVIFISSSSVYAQNSGEIVNEESECSPTRYNGKILIESENLLLNSTLPATIIRFSGIYGPGRFRLIDKSLTTDRQPDEQTHWTNRIHAEDCAAVIKHILEIPKTERHSIYLASDHMPVEQDVVLSWLRQCLGKDLPNRRPESPTRVQAETMQTGKRCSNQRLVESGYHFSYPTYREGFIPIIAEYQKRFAST